MVARQALPLLAAAVALAFAARVQATGQKPGCLVAQALLAGYAALPPDEQRLRRTLLAGARLLGQARTAAAAERVRTRLQARPPAAEQAALLDMLAGLYADGDPTGLNETIARDLRRYAADIDPAIARAAVLGYARLAFRPDQPAVLRVAHGRGLIDDDEYGGALAALLPDAPAADQAPLAGELAHSGNARAAHVLASRLDRAHMRALRPETAHVLLGFAERWEPAFPPEPARYFADDARRDTRWLQAVAGLRDAAGEMAYRDALLAALADPRADPRRALAFLSSPEGSALMREVATREAFTPALARAEAYARVVPQEETVREAAQDARFAVRTLTR